MQVSGSCHCGAIAFEASVDPARVTVCHCTDCQQLTGTAYRVSVGTPKERFALLRGSPAVYVNVGEFGSRRAQAFCRRCGTPLFTYDEDRPEHLGLRVGCLDQRRALRPTRQIWCRSALPWVTDIGALPQRQTE